MPPPPPAVLKATGKPMPRAVASASSAEVSGVIEPGTTGTPASSIRRRAVVLTPIASIASGGGPMKTRPARAHARAKPACSAKKP